MELSRLNHSEPILLFTFCKSYEETFALSPWSERLGAFWGCCRPRRMGIPPRPGVPLVQPLLMGQPLLKPLFGVGAPLLETKAARWCVVHRPITHFG